MRMEHPDICNIQAMITNVLCILDALLILRFLLLIWTL
uniref:Uncharacterized protein n=1 Tax=Heterorhabditis bacteriophora TaxID=37862 RepID=A0A1I7WVF2_HETBA